MKAIDIANAFVVLYGKDDNLTNMKLNKFVYFAYAEKLRAGGQLFDDRLEAWPYGPVVPSVYRAFLTYGKKPIYEPTTTNVSQEAFAIAKNIWNKYGFLTAYDIMEFSHSSTQ